MKRSIFVALFVWAMVGSVVARAGDVQVSKMALMTFSGEVQIAATPADVWAALTDKDKAVSWCPMWKDASNRQPLAQVGNSMDFVDEWKNPGKSVVIFVDEGKELRLAHVPNDGSYVCQLKIVLTPEGNATRVAATEQYSDALDAPTDKDTAAMMKTEMASYLAGLKAVAEKK